jgi:hypothetical protein
VAFDTEFVKSALHKTNYFGLSPISLEFEDFVDWDILSLSHQWATSMSDNKIKPTTSKVGIMSTAQFERLLHPWISPELAKDFRIMIYTSSVIYNLGVRDHYCGYTAPEFYDIRSYTGMQVLNGLEKLLKPSELAKSSNEKIRAIFLLLFGTTLAIVYNHRLLDYTSPV